MHKVVYDLDGKRMHSKFPSQYQLDMFLCALPMRAYIVQVVINGRGEG